MFLNHIVLLLTGLALALALTMRLAAISGRTTGQHGEIESSGVVGAGLAFAMALIFATRDLQFGVDTITYADLFAAYCQGYELRGYGRSFEFSLSLLNVAMLGACKSSLVPLAWAIVMVGFLLLVPARAAHKFAFLGLLLVSLIGLELITNAMRQSFSVGMAVIAVALRERNRPLALLAAAGSIALHLSGALMLTSAFGALFNWRLFLVGMAAAIGIIVISLMFGSIIFFLEPLLYEIEKYLGHESDEIWVRLLAAMCVIIALISPMLAAPPGSRRVLWSDRSYQVALRLGFACIPFLFIPWFGYRYIYGVYPLILWLVMEAVARRPDLFARFFGWALAGNLLVLAVWSNGSSYMRLIPVYA